MFARQRRIAENDRKVSRRYETAIICAWLSNTSGFAKVAKSPHDVYKKMEIKSIEEQDDQEKIQGKRRHYKGSLKSQFEQHERWLESQDIDGDNPKTDCSSRA